MGVGAEKVIGIQIIQERILLQVEIFYRLTGVRWKLGIGGARLMLSTSSITFTSLAGDILKLLKNTKANAIHLYTAAPTMLRRSAPMRSWNEDSLRWFTNTFSFRMVSVMLFMHMAEGAVGKESRSGFLSWLAALT